MAELLEEHAAKATAGPVQGITVSSAPPPTPRSHSRPVRPVRKVWQEVVTCPLSGVASSRPGTTTSRSNNHGGSVLSLRPGLRSRVPRISSLQTFLQSPTAQTSFELSLALGM
ncbi:hypothetical protein Nepgr_021293 [Nepenthes gracilis]|uniref:Uncharacterized protein n=1 Tax=Nepenthes gracilis TaxID=150966 RepID=A0AAD3XVT7_NEPGR|nr:hypothetical protein Nepgr_021293 [Nepenthes gracilis]